MFILFNLIIVDILGVLDRMMGRIDLIGTFYSMTVFIPTLSVLVRQLHDTNRNGWWLLITLIPLIGWIILFVFIIWDGNPGLNQYEANPEE